MSSETATLEKKAAEPVNGKKASKAETGFAKNVANFAEMITAVKTFGAGYNPSAETLAISGLEALRDRANESLIALQKADSIYRDSVNARQSEFEELGKLTTRIKGAVQSAGVDVKINDEISSLNKKITGKRISAEKEEAAGKSASQMSMDSRTYNFRQLVIRLADIPEYKPNESDLTVESLNRYVDSLNAVTAGLQNDLKNLDKARLERDDIMFNENTGLVSVASRVKAYVKSVFGASSLQYKAIAGLNFKNRR